MLVSKKERRLDCLDMLIKSRKIPSFERLHELLQYNPDTGKLTWRVSRGSVKSGDVASCISTKKNGRQDHKIEIDGTRYLSPRVIWALYYHEDPGSLTIDHIDKNPLNNRITNLRLADMHIQNLNTRCTSPSTATRYIGLSMDSCRNRRPRWHGKIRVDGRYYSFGSVAVDSIDDDPPSWLVERAARIYALRDDSGITDDTLIDLLKALKRVSPVMTAAE